MMKEIIMGGLWEHFDPRRLVRHAEDPPDFYGAIVRSRRLATFAALARTGLPR